MNNKRDFNNKKRIFIGVFAFLILLIGFGYAIIETTLSINGNATIDKVGWDIHFENLNSNTEYTLKPNTKINVGGNIEEIETVQQNSATIKTLKKAAVIEIRDQFVTENMIDLEIINEDIEKKKKKIKEIKESMEHRNSETNGISVINYDTTNTNGNSFQDKINMQKRNIQFTKIVEKLKNQIIEQKKKENQLRMNQNNNFCIQAL